MSTILKSDLMKLKCHYLSIFFKQIIKGLTTDKEAAHRSYMDSDLWTSSLLYQADYTGEVTPLDTLMGTEGSNTEY